MWKPLREARKSDPRGIPCVFRPSFAVEYAGNDYRSQRVHIRLPGARMGFALKFSDKRTAVCRFIVVLERDLWENSGMYKHERSKAELSQMSDGEILTPRQVSELLKIPESTLAVWRSTNRFVLPFFKLGHHVRYRRADLEKFIERNMRNAEAE